MRQSKIEPATLYFATRTDLEVERMKRFIARAPKSIWSAFKAIAIDMLDDYNAEFVPPRSIRGYVGRGGPFLRTGYEFLGHFQKHGGLKPDDRVLDVGCGIGRMAIPLTTYLSNSGSYEGLDIVPVGIEWCASTITPRYPNFRFQLVDISNKEYNPKGRLQGMDFRLPFDDKSFDFIFLTSVFTHMLPADVAHYLSEISRVLKPSGRCFITWFLLNEQSRHLIMHGDSSLDFAHPVQGCLTINPDVPEAAIAYDEDRALSFYREHQLAPQQPLYGFWSGRKQFISYQDIIIATRD